MRLHRYFTTNVSNEGFLDKILSKKPKIDPRKPNEAIAILRKTYLDPTWLGGRKLREGEVVLCKEPTLVKADDVSGSFDRMLNQFKVAQAGNIANLKKFDDKLKPFKSFIDAKGKDGPEGKRLLTEAKRLVAPEYLAVTPEENTGEQTVPALDAEGIKRVVDQVVRMLQARLVVDDGVAPLMDKLVKDWHGVNSTYRSKTEHDTDADLIAREIAGLVEEIGSTFDNHVYDRDLQEARDDMVRHLMSWVGNSVK